MNLRDYLAKKLREDGYGGLANDWCGCGLDDFMGCKEPCPDCRPAKWLPRDKCPQAIVCAWDEECRHDGGCWRPAEDDNEAD